MGHTCEKCGEVFLTPTDLARHKNRKKPCDSGVPCPECGHKYSSKKSLSIHVRLGRCKGKSTAVINTELESNIADLQTALQSVQTQRDALMIATDIPQAQAALESLKLCVPNLHSSNALPPDVSSDGRLKLQTLGGIDFVKSQVYFGIPGDMPLLETADRTAMDVTSMQHFQVVKVGYKEQEEHDRFGDHTHQMGGFQVLDSILTQFPVTLERQLLRYLRSENLLIRAKFQKKSGWDKECILIKSYKQYADMFAFVKDMAANLDKPNSSTNDFIRSELELVRSQNISKEVDMRTAEAEARKAAEITRQKEIDLEILKLKLQR